MSYSLSYNSFNEKRADEQWVKFDIFLKELMEKEKKILELEERFKDFERCYTDEEIYDPYFKEQAFQKSKKIAENKEQRKELDELKSEQNIWSDFIYYVNKQEPIDNINVLINLDLAFGGKEAVFSSAIDDIERFHITLMVLFPEARLRENDDLSKKDLINLSKYLGEFDSRFETNRKKLCEKLEMSEDEIDEWRDVIKEMLSRLAPVIKDIVDNDAIFLHRIDGEEDIGGDSLMRILKDRTIKNIEYLKSNLLTVTLVKDFDSLINIKNNGNY